MDKKLLMACMAIAVFAASLVPAVSASPVATDPVGTSLAVGSSITGLTSGNATFTSSVNFICSDAHFTGTLTANTGTQIKGELVQGATIFTGTADKEDCTSSLGSIGVTVNTKLCFETVKGTDNLIITGCTQEMTFSLNVTGATTCKYKGNVTTGATFKTNADATINIVNGQKGTASEPKPIPLEEGGFLCSSTYTLDMHFNLTTTDGSTILVS